MSAAATNVTLTIGARAYTVACAAGEEAHVTALGKIIADKLDAMPSNIALGEARALLFAALLLADELHEMRQANEALMQQVAAPPPADDLSAPLEAIDQRLENIATHLEHGASSA